MLDSIIAGILVTLGIAGLTVAAHSIRRALRGGESDYARLRRAPADHGYARCLKCGLQRPVKLLVNRVCLEAECCARWLASREGGPFMAHEGSPVATGLDANGDAQ